MTGLGETIRGNNSQKHKAPPAEAQAEQPSSREVLAKEGRLVVVGERSGRLVWELEPG